MSALYTRVLPTSAARAALTEATARLRPVGLPEVLAQAALQTRIDEKYLVPVTVLPALVRQLPGRLQILEINGRRAFGYESVYFDTPDLLTYRQHVQGNRRRFKVRTRIYLDSGDCMLEVKVPGGRSETVKHRMPYSSVGRYQLTAAALRFVAERIHRPNTVQLLGPALVTSYYRTTLVDLDAQTRLTCDVDLTCRAHLRATHGLAEHILVETKTAGGVNALGRAFHALGVRPSALSKYCLAVAMLKDGVPANPWHRTLRRCFEWPTATDASGDGTG